MGKSVPPVPGVHLWVLVRDAFGLLTFRERRKAKWLVFFLIGAGIVDAIALASVMPVVTVIVEPTMLEKYQVLEKLRNIFPDITAGQFVIGAAIVAALLLVVSSVLGYVMLWVSNRYGAAIQTRMAHDLMGEAMHAPYSWFLEQNSAGLVRFFHSDIIRWGRDFVLRIITMSQHLIGVVVPLLLLLAMAPGAGVMSLVVVAVIGFFLMRLVQPRIKRAASESKIATDRLVVIANNALSGVKDIKMACREEEFAKDFTDVFGYASRASASLSSWQVLPGAFFVLLGQVALLGLAVMLWTSGLSQGEIAGQMALVVLVTSRVVPAANRFFGLVSTIWNMLPWVEGVIRTKSELDRLSTKSEAPKKSAATEKWQSFVVSEIIFSYGGSSKPAISDLSLDIRRGNLYGLVGASGAGKSTLVDLIIGLYQPQCGTIKLDEVDLNDIDIKTWQRQIGYVPQSPYIADDTIRANIALGVARSEIDDERVRQSLKMANLAEFVESLPDGIHTQVGDRGVCMSGGQRQRLAIARAFYQRPQLLVLDEATSSLDTVSEREVQQAVDRLKGKVTMLIIAHRLSTVRDCDEIFYLEKGCLVAKGNYDALLRDCSGFRTLAAQPVRHAG